MAYEKVTKKIPPRAPAMLEKIIGPRGEVMPESPYNKLAPGLYPDETLVRVDGDLVALSVERHWQENGAGMAYHGYARAIGDDGQTKSPDGIKHLEASFSFNADPYTFQTHGDLPLAAEVARMLLGEDPKLMKDVEVEDGPPEKRPVLDVSDDVRFNASIRDQIKAAALASETKVPL